MTRHKDGGDGEEVVGEFSGRVFANTFAVNHEPGFSVGENKVDEFLAISAQSVTVHDHNFLDSSAVNSFQNGTQAFPFEVEAGGDVGDKFMIGVVSP